MLSYESILTPHPILCIPRHRSEWFEMSAEGDIFVSLNQQINPMSNKLSFWLNNARPISLPQSLLPALTAVALSYGAAQFNWIAALVSIVGVVFLHFALNLLDDWFDYKVGSAEARAKVANEGFRGRMIKYPYLTSGEATHKELLKVIIGFLIAAAACLEKWPQSLHSSQTQSSLA